MNRIVLTTAALLASVSGAYAQSTDDSHRSKWDGAISVESETAQCSGQFVTQGPVRARFHPHINLGGPSSFTRFDGASETVMVQKDGSGQFNGTGCYTLYRISAGEFTQIPDYTGLRPARPLGLSSNDPTYNLTQVPANITTATSFVTLSGTLDNYAGISGCTITIRGAFVKVDGDIPGY